MSGLQLLLGLSILVVLHELGHFLAARAFKTRVEKFYLFFDFLFPFPGLLNFALFKKKIGDTEYGLGWFPLGGYVKIAGMMDESMDEESLKLPPKEDEYRSKKNWQKLIIMLGGIIMNLLVGWIIYSQLLFWVGDTKVPAEGTKYGIHCDTLALMAGLKDGDIILSHDDGKKFDDFHSIFKEILLDDIKVIEINRDGQNISITLPSDYKKNVLQQPRKVKGFIDPRFLCVVDSFSAESVVKDKLKKGDRLININGSPINYFCDAPPVLTSLKGKDATVFFLRGSDTMNFTVKVPASGLLGFNPLFDSTALTMSESHYGFGESFVAGAARSGKTIKDYLKQLKLLPIAWKQLGGVGSMAQLYGSKESEGWNWVRFWSATALISLILAIMNLLPIPMLDGGYVIILLVEMIIRRPLNEKFLENLQRIGFILIIFLMVFANGNDLYRWIMEKFFHQ